MITPRTHLTGLATDQDVRDRVLERLLQCTLTLCRAQRANGTQDELVQDVIASLDIAIRETSDSGQPIVVSRPGSPHAGAYRTIARRVLEKLALGAQRKAPPKIVVQ